MTSTKAVILDVDGTVATCPYDFEAMRAAVAGVAEKWGWREEGEQFPRPPAGTAARFADLAARGVVERIAHIAEALGDRGAGFRAEAEQAVVEIELEGARSSRLLEGAAETLAGLRQRGVRVGLITRNCRAATERVLVGLSSYDLLLTRDDVPRAKPDPDHVHRALALLGCSPDEAVVVGDHIFDMQAGRAAGVRHCVGLRTGSSSDEDLLAAGAEVLLDDISELPKWLGAVTGASGPAQPGEHS